MLCEQIVPKIRSSYPIVYVQVNVGILYCVYATIVCIHRDATVPTHGPSSSASAWSRRARINQPARKLSQGNRTAKILLTVLQLKTLSQIWTNAHVIWLQYLPMWTISFKNEIRQIIERIESTKVTNIYESDHQTTTTILKDEQLQTSRRITVTYRNKTIVSFGKL